MGVKNPWAVKQLVRAAQQLDASRLYERFSDRDCFLIRTPRLDEPAVAVLMGFGGESFGLSLFLGPEAIPSYQAMYASGGGARGTRVMGRTHMLGYQMSDTRDLTHDARRWLKKAKVRPTGDQLLPDPMCIEPGKTPRVMLEDRETRLLHRAVRGILTASEDPAFAPSGIGPDGRVLCLHIDGDRDQPTVRITWESVDDHDGADRRTSDAPATASPLASYFDLTSLSRSGDSWFVGLLRMPGAIEGDDRQLYFLIVGSEQNENFWPGPLLSLDPADAVNTLADLMRGEVEALDGPDTGMLAALPPPAGLPTRIILDSADLYCAAHGAFGPLGIECVDGSNDAVLQAMLDELETSFNALMLHGDEEAFLPGDLTDVPADDDLEGWKEVDGLLKAMLYRGFDSDDRFVGARALKRYFGRDADVDALFHEFHHAMVVDSYAHWFAIHYRSARNRQTLAEQWLDDVDLPVALKQLIEAAVAHGPSLYRVDEADEDTGKITFADLFTGEITIATDFALSTCLEPGQILPGKLVPVGDFHFYFAAGPLMTSLEITAVMDFFKRQRITPAPETFRKQPHVFGWLWDVVSEIRERPIDIRNTDGHALLLHEARFACPDRGVLERFLADQDDWEPDNQPDAWVWLRPDIEKPADQVRGTHEFELHQEDADRTVVRLAQLEVGDGEITLHTNSRERFEAGRAVLERIPGVVLRSVQTFDRPEAGVTESSAEADEPAEPLDEQTIEALQAYITQHYRQWLDQPLPALDGRTPRQAATHRKLRPRLAAMVRAMPDPVNPTHADVTIQAPREMLLAELGLD